MYRRRHADLVADRCPVPVRSRTVRSDQDRSAARPQEAPGYPADLAERAGVTRQGDVEPPGLSAGAVGWSSRCPRVGVPGTSWPTSRIGHALYRPARPRAGRRPRLLRRHRRWCRARGHGGGVDVIILSSGPSPARRAVLTRRIRWFVAATITYNLIEAAVALTAGVRGVIHGAARLRPRLGDRGVLGRRGRLAVLRS